MKHTLITLHIAGMTAMFIGTGVRAESTPFPEGLTASDWSGIRAAHEAGRHAVVAKTDGLLAARNPGQQWQTQFDGRGFSVSPDAGGWNWGLELMHYGFAGAERPVSGTAATAHDGGRVHYDWDRFLREWFVNDRRGLQQGWTIHERPPGAQGGEPLRLRFAVRGGLTPQVAADGAAVGFDDDTGSRIVNFGGLIAWDADGRPLSAGFETIERDGEAAILEIALEENKARYPVTIDPIAQQAYLKASNTGASDYFGGESVAVSGDTVVVGAYAEDSNATGIDGDGSDNSAEDAGAAYVFVRNGGTWSQQAYLKASNTDAGDEFGRSVAVSGDTVVVAASQEGSSATGIDGDQVNNDAENSGAVYVFVRDGTTWSQQAYLKASNPDSHDRFGASVAVSGNTVVVGSTGERSNATGVDGDQGNNSANYSGAAYVFVRDGTTWSQQAYLKASNTDAGDRFGSSVGVSSDTVVVGAIFEDSAANGIDGAQTDNSVSQSGAAYVFVRSGTAWSQQAYLKASNTDTDDWFGNTLAVSGNTVVVGTPYEDSAAMGINGDQNDNSAESSGAAYVFARSGTTWSQQAYLKGSNTEGRDYFAGSVAVSGDTVVVGAENEDSAASGIDGDQSDNSLGSSGAAYVFMRIGTTWTQQAYLKASNPGNDDSFGSAVAVAGDTVVVGAYLESSGATGVNGNESDNSTDYSGAAYVFLAPPLAAEILVEQPLGVDLPDGGTRSIGGAPVGENTSLTFTIRNIGEGSLTGLTVTKDGADASEFTITESPVAPLASGDRTILTVRLDPATVGSKTAAVHIASNDDNENPFDITLTGRGLTAADDTDGDGMNDLAEFKLADLGFDWEVTQTALVDSLMNNASYSGLYTESEIRNIHVGAPLVEVEGGTVNLELQLQKSDDLDTWLPFGDPVEWSEAAGSKQFYRLFFDDTAP